MSYGRILKVLVFYLFLAFVVIFLGPFGYLQGYVLIIAITIPFLLTSRIPLRLGNPLHGTLAGTLASMGTFLAMLAPGGIAVIGVNGNAMTALAYGIAIQGLVACGEELSFRQYIFEDLDRAAGRNAAIALSALGFALLHVSSMLSFGESPVAILVGLATITLAGALLAVLYIYGGLLSAIGFHFCWNFLQYHVLGLGLRGEMPALLDVTQTGNTLLTGGPFGPEASLPGLAIMLITLGLTWGYYARKQQTKDVKA